MNPLYELMIKQISGSLKRQSIDSCSKWAEQYRVMDKPVKANWSFKYRPWLRDMHDSEAEVNIGQKSAQMGYTETALNLAFFNIDVKRADVLYVLPAKTPDAGDFSAARFDPALELSPHLERIFSDVKNIGHKRAGSANMYIRGSKSRAGLKSIPTGVIILDEVDEMVQENVPLATERSAGQKEKLLWAISTPTVPGYGINEMYEGSSKERFHFRCPGCSKLTELIFPQCLIITSEDPFDNKIKDSHIICKECKIVLEHETKHIWLKDGIWVPENTDKDSRGFYINQLYSSTVRPYELARNYLKSLYNPTEEQEFYNSKLGLPHVVASAQLNDSDIDRTIGQHRKGRQGATTRLITMGVDVGKWLHYEVNEWYLGQSHGNDINTLATPRVIDFGKVEHFDQLDKIMHDFGVTFCVIDANPERRAAIQFANRFYGAVKICFYGQNIAGKEIREDKQDQITISVDRTSWLDLSLGRFKRDKAIILPVDIDFEYRSHLKALIRIYKKDKDGNPVGRYENGSREDHYAHARNYAEIALTFATSMANPRNIKSPV
jgi:hypothetical protein